MGEREFVAVVHATSICVRNIPECTGHVLLPIVNTIVIYVSGILYPSRVGLSWVDYSIPVEVLFTVIELVAVGVVVPGVGCLRGVTV